MTIDTPAAAAAGPTDRVYAIAVYLVLASLSFYIVLFNTMHAWRFWDAILPPVLAGAMFTLGCRVDDETRGRVSGHLPE